MLDRWSFKQKIATIVLTGVAIVILLSILSVLESRRALTEARRLELVTAVQAAHNIVLGYRDKAEKQQMPVEEAQNAAAAAASSLRSQAEELVQTVAVFKIEEGPAAPSPMKVRAPASAAKPFAGQDRRTGNNTPNAGTRPSTAAKPAPRPAAKAVPAQLAANKPAPTPKAAAGGDDDWETF